MSSEKGHTMSKKQMRKRKRESTPRRAVGPRILTLAHLVRVARARRCVACGLGAHPLPAAFILHMQAERVWELIGMGMWEYEARRPGRRGAPWVEKSTRFPFLYTLTAHGVDDE